MLCAPFSRYRNRGIGSALIVRLMDEPDWQCRLPPIEEIFFATSPSAKTLRPDERQPFKERWLGRYIAYDIESFFVAITEVSTVAGYLAGCMLLSPGDARSFIVRCVCRAGRERGTFRHPRRHRR